MISCSLISYVGYSEKLNIMKYKYVTSSLRYTNLILSFYK